MPTFSHDLAIDLGTSNLLVYVKGKGIVINEPSVVSVRKNESGTNNIVAFGTEAKMMIGKTPERIEVIRPIRDGVIADFEITEIMLRHFIQKVYQRRFLVRPRIIIAVPIGITPVEKKAIFECAKSAGASEVFLIEEPMAAAIGAGLPITEPKGNMIVDIGGGTLEIAVISLGGIVYNRSVRVAGDKMDESIVQSINRNHKFAIGLGTAEMIKNHLGNAMPDENTTTMEVRGRDLVSGIPKSIPIRSDEVTKIISEQVNTIVQTVILALEQMPPELSGDILEKGIALTGGVSLLKNLDVLLKQKTKVPIIVSEEPFFNVATGAGKALESISILKEIVIE
ncbi:MAG: rod shape-determining protein [Deltaproteobacteria bacterium]|nr:rod shape-determining protein [Deltaproteobacteria bacterium]